MTAQLISLAPQELASRLKAGRAVLVDIRDADEFARRHARGALSRPLQGFEMAHLRIEPDRDVVFTCKSGMRTAANCERLKSAVDGEAFVLEGGLDAWAAAGLPVEAGRTAPLEIMRQGQIAAGLLVLVGVALGYLVSPLLFGLSALIGAGLLLAGVTGHCGMARILASAPWNRRAA